MKRLLNLFFALAMLLGVAQAVVAQYYSSPSMTYFTPFSMSTNTEDVTFYLADGSSYFTGKKLTTITNGQVSNVTYRGTIHWSNGERTLTGPAGNGFDQNFNYQDGYFWHIASDGRLFKLTVQNGSLVNQEIDNREYSISNENTIQFPQVYTPSTGGTYYGGSTYNSNSSSSSSTYDSHTAICRGCNGSGKCSHCNGRGYTSNNIKCSMCNGRGTCKSCAGLGKFHGNY